MNAFHSLLLPIIFQFHITPRLYGEFKLAVWNQPKPQRLEFYVIRTKLRCDEAAIH